MRFPVYWSDPDRWNWYAAGDKPVGRSKASCLSGHSSQQVLFEIGLALFATLFFAAVFGVLFAS